MELGRPGNRSSQVTAYGFPRRYFAYRPIFRVNINIASVAGYLPSSTEDNNAAFAGITPKPQGFQSTIPSLAPLQEATLRAYQVDVQMKDAEERNVVWGVDGDDDDRDAEGESDDGYILTADGTYERANPGVDHHAPIGLRNQDGHIVPMPLISDANGRLAGNLSANADSVSVPEAQFGGVSETVPSRVGELVSLSRFLTRWVC